jgi:hypothetical protein
MIELQEITPENHRLDQLSFSKRKPHQNINLS